MSQWYIMALDAHEAGMHTAVHDEREQEVQRAFPAADEQFAPEPAFERLRQMQEGVMQPVFGCPAHRPLATLALAGRVLLLLWRLRAVFCSEV